MAVKREARRKNIGRKLLDYVTNEICKAGLRRVELTTWEDNAPSRRLYDKAGFTFYNQAGNYVYYKKACVK